MKYLLDSVAFLRASDNTLPGRTSRRLQKAGAELLISIVTPWEIALKSSLQFRGFSNAVVRQLIFEMGARLLPVTVEHTGALVKLPKFPQHRDPFDRMLVVQALDEQCVLVSSDRAFSLYGESGLEVLWE